MKFSQLVLSWYDEHARTLPWRGSRDPYVIWVSEIIFQQTRIEQGMGYFLRFIDRFPTLEDLAAADQDTVLRMWQGLGYYSRARNMLFTARQIREDLDGRFPRDYTSIRKLKGIGDYTASCISSICFGEVQAAVDGNVYRVLARYFAEPLPIDSVAGKNHFRQLAQQLISPERPGDFNEAMMDLGAMVCRPRVPDCTVCPLQWDCSAFERQTQEVFPVKGAAASRPVTVMNYIVTGSGDRLLIRQRQGKGIWNGLYEFPLVTGDQTEEQIAEECRASYGLELSAITPVRQVRHLLSHVVLDIRFFSAGQEQTDPLSVNELLSVPAGDLKNYPFPKPLVDYLEDWDPLTSPSCPDLARNLH